MLNDCSENSGRTLLYHACNNETEAWKDIVHLYCPLVYYWCRQSGLHPIDVNTVGQDIFLSVARQLADFRQDRIGSTFCDWLRAMTKAKIAEFNLRVLRESPSGRNTENQFVTSPNAENEDSEESIRKESRILIEQAIEIIRSEFAERDWQIFYRLLVAKDLPSTIAHDLKVPLTSVYLVKSRIRKKLRSYFAELIEERHLP